MGRAGSTGRWSVRSKGGGSHLHQDMGWETEHREASSLFGAPSRALGHEG